MSVVVQLLRGSTADNEGLTAPVGVITVDTDGLNLRLHDGLTGGGFIVAGPVAVARVTSGTSVSLSAIKSYETMIVWVSATGGAKSTSIPGSAAANDGCKLLVSAQMNNGDTHTVTPAAGTINGGSSYSFTDSRSTLTLISDGTGTNWIIT
jgi:hypothetical protein